MANPSDQGSTIPAPTVLIACESATTADLLRQRVCQLGFSAQHVTASAPGFWDSYYDDTSIVLSVAGDSGDVMNEVFAHDPFARVIVVDHHASLDAAIAAIRSGAVDYLKADEGDVTYLAALERALAARESRFQYERLVADLEDARARLADIVNRDGLTGLFKYRYFEEQARDELGHAERASYPVSLVVMEIAQLDDLVERHGVRAGDEVLQAASAVLRRFVRSADLLARFGATRFIGLLPDTSDERSELVGARLQREIAAHPFPVGQLRVPVQLNAGIATYPDNASDYDELLQQAVEDLNLHGDRRRDSTLGSNGPGLKAAS